MVNRSCSVKEQKPQCSNGRSDYASDPPPGLEFTTTSFQIPVTVPWTGYYSHLCNSAFSTGLLIQGDATICWIVPAHFRDMQAGASSLKPRKRLLSRFCRHPKECRVQQGLFSPLGTCPIWSGVTSTAQPHIFLAQRCGTPALAMSNPSIRPWCYIIRNINRWPLLAYGMGKNVSGSRETRSVCSLAKHSSDWPTRLCTEHTGPFSEHARHCLHALLRNADANNGTRISATEHVTCAIAPAWLGDS